MTLEEVIERGYAKEVYEYALNHPEADMDYLTKVLINCDKLPDVFFYYDYEDDYDFSPEWSDECLSYYYFVFARDIKGANIRLLEDKLVEELRFEYVFQFAHDVKGADVIFLEKYGLWLASGEEIIKYACEIEGADIEFLQDLLINEETILYKRDCNPKEFCAALKSFAYKVIGADIDKMIYIIKQCIENYDREHDYYIDMLNDTIDYLELIKSKKEKKLIKNK